MPEKRPNETKPENPTLYRQRPLENGGTLFIFEQIHGTFYPRRAIEQDIEDIAPDILLIENTFSVGPGLDSGQGFLDAAVHQLGIAKKLGIPVVLPDVIGTGVIDQSDHPFDSSSNSLVADQNAAFSSLFLKVAAPFLAATLISTVINNLAGPQQSSEKGPIISRREFFRFAAKASLVLACAPSFALPVLTLAIEEGRAGSINSPGFIDLAQNGRLLANVDSIIYDFWQDGEKTEQYILGLRNAKYIATPEAASVYLQSSQAKTAPKVGLVVGSRHAQYLENLDRHNTGKKRAETVIRALENVFLPIYHSLLNKVGNNKEDRQKIFTRAVLDLANITVAGVYNVTNLDAFVSEKMLNPLGYLICEDIAAGVRAALTDEPELLAAYQTKLGQLRHHKI